jgi:hypothetical protein
MLHPLFPNLWVPHITIASIFMLVYRIPFCALLRGGKESPAGARARGVGRSLPNLGYKSMKSQ